MSLFGIRRPQPKPEAAPDYWMSYSDVMAGLIFAFILLMTLVMADFRHQERAALRQEQELRQALRENDEMRQEIAQLLGVKSEIISRLSQEFGDRITLDPQTGAITFADKLLFGFNSRVLTDEGKTRLQEFIPQYVGVLLSPEFRPHVAQIIVEGHTDSSGDYLYNLDLSQARAVAVVRYIFDEKFPSFGEREDLKRYLTANGRSFSQLKIVDGAEDREASRRVEFQFRLRDEDAIKRVQAMLEGGGTGP